MKKIRKLNTPTSGLAEYLAAVGDDANWDEFCSHSSSTASLRELKNALIQNQHGLCAYCETEIGGWLSQVEHVIPQSDNRLGKAKALDIANMVACCLGGTRSESGLGRRGMPTCGQAKRNLNDENFIDPRILPALPSLTRVSDDGEIEADENACQMAGFLPDHVTRTIDILKLNERRLRLAREELWNDLEEESGQIDYDMRDAWMRSVLVPDDDGRLSPFFTTTRSYFGPVAEHVLGQQPQTWI